MLVDRTVRGTLRLRPTRYPVGRNAPDDARNQPPAQALLHTLHGVRKRWFAHQTCRHDRRDGGHGSGHEQTATPRKNCVQQIRERLRGLANLHYLIGQCGALAIDRCD